MEEKKSNEPKKEVVQQHKLTYGELAQKFNELDLQYRKLMKAYQNAMAQLNDNAFNYTSFFVSMLFKVMEHPEQYKPEFVKWASENIMGSLTTFAQSFASQEENQNTKDDAKAE